MLWANYIIQVHVPGRRFTKSFVFKMKCQLTSTATHEVMISKEINVRSYKDICGGEPRKMMLGYNNQWQSRAPVLRVENNTLIHYPPKMYLFGQTTDMSHDWEVLYKFFTLHNIEAHWLDCKMSWGHYDKNIGAWAGCMGKVRRSQY